MRGHTQQNLKLFLSKINTRKARNNELPPIGLPQEVLTIIARCTLPYLKLVRAWHRRGYACADLTPSAKWQPLTLCQMAASWQPLTQIVSGKAVEPGTDAYWSAWRGAEATRRFRRR